VIQPIFNKFEQLKDESLKLEIEKLFVELLPLLLFTICSIGCLSLS